MQQNNNKWDTNYEWKVVVLLALAFGFVGMDRFVIGTLWNTISADLGLDPGAIGNLAGLTAVAWGLFAIIFGRLADRWGHRKIILTSVVLFSLMGGVTGLATGMTFFILIRTLLGITEGAYTPTSFTAVAVASKPSRRGLNQGFQQCGVALLGLALAPIIATQMLNAGISWRMIFILIALPGFIFAFLLWRVLKEPKDTQGAEALGVVQETDDISFGELLISYAGPLKSYNVVIATLALLGAMCGLFTMAAFMPVYLENVVGLSLGEMGIVTSAVGFGGFFGQFGWPGLSDKLGRKPVCIIGFAAAAACLYWFLQIEAGVGALFVPLFLSAFFCFGNIALITGPIATEAAPVGMVAASIGVVVGVGEIFGGGLGPIVGSFVVPNMGLSGPLYVALYGMIFGFVLSLFLKETAPIKTAATNPQAIDESGPVA
ncbi:MAG: MFS transporter [SAR86 cluster bacterium]|uniref:MFS transporter n=1 Tax=SAR86 cluster bacterium TaxID=2030880 RepID=A0A2A5C825_9GAMM|nr:MAG: MFS transporter [SAR86 cluster bacterium]